MLGSNKCLRFSPGVLIPTVLGQSLFDWLTLFELLCCLSRAVQQQTMLKNSWTPWALHACVLLLPTYGCSFLPAVTPKVGTEHTLKQAKCSAMTLLRWGLAGLVGAGLRAVLQGAWASRLGEDKRTKLSLLVWNCVRRGSGWVLEKGSLPEGGGHGTGCQGQPSRPELPQVSNAWTRL